MIFQIFIIDEYNCINNGGSDSLYLLGIDGGGTKTEGVIADAYGNVFARVVTGPSNPTSMSREDFERIME